MTAARFRTTVLFGLYSLVVIVCCAPILHVLVNVAAADDTVSHTLVVPFITLALIFDRRDLVLGRPAPFDALGIGIALAGAGVLAGGALVRPSTAWLSIAMIGFVALLLGGFVFVYGRSVARSLAFPLLFLAFMIPIPHVVLAPMTELLKAGSARVVAALLTVTGTPYYQDRFVFELPKFVIEIGDECSGIRSSIALLLTTLIAGDLYLVEIRSKALLAASVLPIAILKNGVRIVALSLLASYVDPGFLTGQLHHEGGVLFFLLVLPVVGLAMIVLRRWETGAAWAILRVRSQTSTVGTTT